MIDPVRVVFYEAVERVEVVALLIWELLCPS